jgi:hypothetical protein
LRYAKAVLATDADAELMLHRALAGELKQWPMERGRLLLAYGASLRRRQRVGESRRPLRAARDDFDPPGAHPWGDRVRAELRASGEVSGGGSAPPGTGCHHRNCRLPSSPRTG